MKLIALKFATMLCLLPGLAMGTAVMAKEADKAKAEEAAPARNIGHDGKHLAGAFITEDLEGNVGYWTITPDDRMIMTMNGIARTARHYKGEDGRNCIAFDDGLDPPFCFNESKVTPKGRWMAIKDSGEGVIVTRLTVAPFPDETE